MPKGGARPNSGPKKGTKYAPTIAKEAAREHLRGILTAQLEPVAKALVSRATGVRYFVARNSKTGKFEIVTDPQKVLAALNAEDDMTGEFYTEKPDTAAIKELFDRTCDKSKEQEQEITVSGSINVVEILRQRSARNRAKA